MLRQQRAARCRERPGLTGRRQHTQSLDGGLHDPSSNIQRKITPPPTLIRLSKPPTLPQGRLAQRPRRHRLRIDTLRLRPRHRNRRRRRIIPRHPHRLLRPRLRPQRPRAHTSIHASIQSPHALRTTPRPSATEAGTSHRHDLHYGLREGQSPLHPPRPLLRPALRALPQAHHRWRL